MKKDFTPVLLIAVLLTIFTACAKPATPPTASELLDLGEKYLLELDYEQALVQFFAVIEIEPMNPRGYTGAAEAYVAMGDTDAAKAVLERGRDATGDAEMAEILAGLTVAVGTSTATPTVEETPESTPEESYYELLSDEKKQLLNTLEQAVRAHDYATACVIQESAEFVALMGEIYVVLDGGKLSYSPDENSLIHVWGNGADGNHMNIYIGNGGAGHHVASRYRNHESNNYVMQIVDYSGGNANGPFTYNIDNFDGSGFLLMSGNMTDGSCYGEDVTFESTDGYIAQGAWDGYYTFPQWEGK